MALACFTLFLWLVLVRGAFWGLGWVVVAYQWFWDAAVVLKWMPECVSTVHIICFDSSVGDKMHLVFECTHLHFLQQKYSHLFGPTVRDTRGFFSQKDKVAVVKFHIGCPQTAYISVTFAFGHM